MSKHTKGPWIINANRIKGGDYPDGIAHVMDADAGEIRNANARLIAAAPELLEALKIAIRVGVAQKCSSEQIDLIEKAIAKAEGDEK